MLSSVQLFAIPWTAAHQASLSFTISLNLFKLISIESVMLSNHLILCCLFLLLPSIFPSIRAISNELALYISSVQFSCSVVSDFLRPHELQHTRPPCPSPTPRVHTNPCPSSQWCYPTISSSVVPFSSCPQSFAISGSLQMSQLFTSGGQSIGVSASTSVLPMNTQDWPLGWTGWISLQSRGLSQLSKSENEQWCIITVSSSDSIQVFPLSQ